MHLAKIFFLILCTCLFSWLVVSFAVKFSYFTQSHLSGLDVASELLESFSENPDYTPVLKFPPVVLSPSLSPWAHCQLISAHGERWGFNADAPPVLGWLFSWGCPWHLAEKQGAVFVLLHSWKLTPPCPVLCTAVFKH